MPMDEISFEAIEARIQEIEKWLDEVEQEEIVRRVMLRPGLAAFGVAVREIVEKHYRRWRATHSRV